MEQVFKDGKLYLQRTEDERHPIVARLSRIEGQVRGIRQMIENDRYCGDELQQVNAVMAAMREVAVMITLQHCAAGVNHAIASADHEGPVEEMMGLLRTVLKL